MVDSVIASDQTTTQPANTTAFAFDEMNLCEFGLAAVSNRHLDGRKTVIFEDTVFDQDKRRQMPRKLAISGSDLYGLPTAMDDDVLLACIQLTDPNKLTSGEVYFSRYELLQLLRWDDSTRNYRRVSQSLMRWAGLTIYSKRAFYDHLRKSWVNRAFSVFDDVRIYERELTEEVTGPRTSRLVWSDFFFNNFQAGYLRKLDWDLYHSLQSPVAKRLYRFLDKRFYRPGRVEVDLRELAERKVRLSTKNKLADHRRELLKGIRELETVWGLKPMSQAKRFRQESRQKWTVIFDRRLSRGAKTQPSVSTGNTLRLVSKASRKQATTTPNTWAEKLAMVGVSSRMSEKLANESDPKTIERMLSLFAYYGQINVRRDPGFLVNCLRNPESVTFPPGFNEWARKPTRPAARKQPSKSEQPNRGRLDKSSKTDLRKRFDEFWQTLTPSQQSDYEREAESQCPRMLKEGLMQSRKRGGETFEAYRMAILLNRFSTQPESKQP